jgi:hypothetical protein
MRAFSPAQPPARRVSSYDAAAQDYFTRAEALGGSFNQSGINATYTAAYVKNAINVFVLGCKTDSIWTKLTEVYLLAGVSFGGILAKLKYTSVATLTNTNFVTGNYLAAGSGAGILGANTKFLGTSYITPTIVGYGLSAYSTAAIVSGFATAWFSDGVVADRIAVPAYRTDKMSYEFTGYGVTFLNGTVDNGQGFYTATRASTTSLIAYKNGVQNATNTTSSTGTNAGPLKIFDGGTNGLRTSMAIAHEHLTAGQALNLSTRVNTLMTALGTNVY